MRVLIVEDDPMVMRLNVDYLNRLDEVQLVAQCDSVPSAIDVLDQERVDLVLLDVYLRNRSGLEVIRHLQRTGCDTDVVLITAATETETVRAARRLGVSDYLVKPFTFERFRDAVQACRQARKTLEGLSDRVAQQDIDRLFQPMSAPEPRRPGDLPKGLTATSLSQVAQAILALPDGNFTTETLMPATGMSRVSVRKYLKYLAESGVLAESFHYGQVGRPSFTYRCQDRTALERLITSAH
ncbi:response regulator [Halomonas sp. McH1-25]|uniref:response regulator n=1 Tax=unclassified Halomonas TaxID=2609666 RepID=UPI001EF4DD03|nr:MULTISPECIES: response regulator [unclassified Halomonas]MCG7601469.1 response regulator [Halomonas sp. McH1-25]MCP1344770.1 response regulator [Halomonas sp. FL8]MCP1363583.1 response regulator [Halomonas sp. BBD45]MCP1367632.1 response regulator [Halomonas sp. BBD48]